MSLEENRKLALRPHEEVFNQDNLAAADQIFAAEYTWYSPGVPPDLPRGPSGVKRFATALRVAFPDYRLTTKQTVAEGDTVVYRWEMRGTHKADFAGIPATGKQVTVTGIDVFRIANGKIVENRQELNMLGLLQQLGAVGSPQPAPASH